MAVAPTRSEAIERQVVEVGWDMGAVTGEIVQLRCENPENGDVSVSGASRNDGLAFVSYPLGYTGKTQITVQDFQGNSDTGFIEVDGEGGATVPEIPDPPPDVIPPDTGEGGTPEHPIELPPEPVDPDAPHVDHELPIPPDFWIGNLPPYVHIQPISG